MMSSVSAIQQLTRAEQLSYAEWFAIRRIVIIVWTVVTTWRFK